MLIFLNVITNRLKLYKALLAYLHTVYLFFFYIFKIALLIASCKLQHLLESVHKQLCNETDLAN